MIKINLPQEDQNIILADNSEILATRIIIHRLLNSFHEEAKLAMYELMRRRIQDKEQFDFETFIENGIKENQIDVKIPSINDIKKNFIQKTIYSLLTKQDDKINEEDIDDMSEEEKDVIPEEDPKKEKDINEVIETLVNVL